MASYFNSFKYKEKEISKVNNKTIHSITINGVTYYALSSWEEPTQTNNTLYITQIYSAIQTDNNLTIT